MTELQWLFPWLKFAHVLLAIVAVGFNVSYGIWIGRASKDPRHLGHVLRGVQLLDGRFANPAYGLLLLTGLGMVVVGGLDLSQLWLGGSLGLWLLAVVIGVVLYAPTLREQIEALESAGPDSPLYAELSRRGTWLGIVLGVIVLVIVAFMVLKPGAA